MEKCAEKFGLPATDQTHVCFKIILLKSARFKKVGVHFCPFMYYWELGCGSFIIDPTFPISIQTTFDFQGMVSGMWLLTVSLGSFIGTSAGSIIYDQENYS